MLELLGKEGKEGGAAEKQQRVIEEQSWNEAKHLVVEACPGSGKTTTLLNRVLRGLRRGYCRAPKVVLISFTKEAANNFKSRLRQRNAEPLKCVTVHGWAYELLAKNEKFCLQEEGEGLRIFERLLEEGHGPKGPMWDDCSVSDLWQEMNRRREERLLEGFEDICDRYCTEVRKLGFVDFTMLLERCVERKLTHRGFTHVIVDEFQDLSRLQLEFLAHCHPRANFEWYGDSNQAIYGFKGTGDVNTGMIAKVFGCKESDIVVRSMDWSWRCPDRLMQAASRGLGLPGQRLRGVHAGGLLSVRCYGTLEEEVRAATLWLEEDASRRVLVRTRKLVALFGEPYQDRVKTLHASKGLEWSAVWILHAVEGCIPHVMGDDREERRLLYVGVTRAKQEVVVSWAERNAQGTVLRPSRWLSLLEELDWGGREDDDEEY